jgi:hypothetical protein
VGNHIGKYVKNDDLNNCGSWRKYLRIRVAININEPLKKSLVFDRDEGEPVQIHFKYEKLGNFCFACGVIGHTENFCTKHYDATFTEVEKGWGNYLRAENSNTSGGVAANRWLRGGRSSDRGGRGGAVNAGFNAVTDNAAINANVTQHAIHGRIKIGRDASTRKLIFYKLMEEKLEGINTGNYCWAKFDIVTGKLLNANDEGSSNRTQRINEHSLSVLRGPQSMSGGPGTQLHIRGATENNKLITSPTNILLNPCFLDQTKNPIQLLLDGTSDTLIQEVVPKKRARKDKEMLDKEDAAISKASHKNDMQVDTESAATGVAGSDIIMQQNPLFDVNIVMAGPGHQACQKK